MKGRALLARAKGRRSWRLEARWRVVTTIRVAPACLRSLLEGLPFVCALVPSMVTADRPQQELYIAFAEAISDPKFEVTMDVVRQGSTHHVTI